MPLSNFPLPGQLYSGITPHTKANGMPWDVMPERWISDKDLITLLQFVADWGWLSPTPNRFVSRAQGGLGDRRGNGLALLVRELT